jgi:hypothetical protein
MIGLIKKIFILLIGAALLPLTITVSKAFYCQLSGISVFESKNQMYFLYGVAAYIVLHLFFFKLNYVYNFGHEVIHVIPTWLSYFVPIYTVMLCAAYFFISKFNDISQYAPAFIFFIGFTLAMHIVLTVDSLKISQTDLVRTGYLFSLSLIYVINIIVAGFVISLIFTGFSFVDFFMQCYVETKALYLLIFRQLFGV